MNSHGGKPKEISFPGLLNHQISSGRRANNRKKDNSHTARSVLKTVAMNVWLCYWKVKNECRRFQERFEIYSVHNKILRSSKQCTAFAVNCGSPRIWHSISCQATVRLCLKNTKHFAERCAVGRDGERGLFCRQWSHKGMPTYVIFKVEGTKKRLGIECTFTLQSRNICVLWLLQDFTFIHVSAETVNGGKVPSIDVNEKKTYSYPKTKKY